ncbi:MAG: hypothetical protein N2035_00830 [Chthoniobacterales bacterium]|nr:hypothetical protein [Chthoniobacterales bacterium]
MKLLLVDGHYYLYRSFHAVHGLRNSSGQPTNALFGFAKALLKMLDDLKPSHGAVFWDAGIPHERLHLCPAYKQNRPPMPSDLKLQEPPARNLPTLLGLQSLSLPNYEADDLIYAYASSAPPTAETFIASADKDILPLISPNCKIYSTNKADLPSPNSSYALLGEKEIHAKWGVPPHSIPELLSLTGDASDNIPGVPGIGPKTATTLLNQFGSLHNLLQNLDQIPNPKLRSQLTNSKNQILTNLQIIRPHPPQYLPTPFETLALSPQPEKLHNFFQTWEFHSLLNSPPKNKKLPNPTPPPAQGYLPLQFPSS